MASKAGPTACPSPCSVGTKLTAARCGRSWVACWRSGHQLKLGVLHRCPASLPQGAGAEKGGGAAGSRLAPAQAAARTPRASQPPRGRACCGERGRCSALPPRGTISSITCPHLARLAYPVLSPSTSTLRQLADKGQCISAWNRHSLAVHLAALKYNGHRNRTKGCALKKVP